MVGVGSGLQHIHLVDLRRDFIPVAPAHERSEIVRRGRAALAWIDRLASEATSARKLIDHLDQAVLAKAFRGELVPQDPKDEPASVLLERIRAESAPRGGGKRQKATRSNFGKR
jgi:type I restriction enzyme S subunit